MLIMMNDGDMPATSYWFCSQPVNSGAYIINIFTGHCHDNVFGHSKSLFTSDFVR